MSSPRRFVFVDLNGLVHRAFHGYPANCGRIAFEWVYRALKAIRPTHGAAAADLPFPTFRHELAPALYKAKGRLEGADRARVCEGLRECEGLLEDLLGVRTLAARGFEGDDVIASLVGLAHSPRFSPSGGEQTNAEDEVFIVARDKDLCQLVDARTTMVDFQDGRHLGPDEVKEKFGVAPSQMVDWLALAGDSGDGYPGCPGIGAKGAAEILCEVGSLSAILRETSEGIVLTSAKLKPKHLEKLRAGASEVLLSRQLAKLRFDAPLELSSVDELRLPSLPKRLRAGGDLE